MGDADDAEILEPTASTRVSRAPYPFKRERSGPTREPCTTTEKLCVVYNRQFDRFFLREAMASHQPSLPTRSPKPRHAGARSAPAKKRNSLATSVQWEDLLIPPRSVTKRRSDLSCDYSGLKDEDGNVQDTGVDEATVGVGAGQPLAPAISSVQEAHVTSLNEPADRYEPKRNESLETEAAVDHDMAMQSEVPSETTLGTARPPDATTDTQCDSQPDSTNHAPRVGDDSSPRVEVPVVIASIGNAMADSGSHISFSEPTPATSSLAEAPVPASSVVPHTELETPEVATIEHRPCEQIVIASIAPIESMDVANSDELDPTTAATPPPKALSKLVAAVRLFRVLRRFMRRWKVSSQNSSSHDEKPCSDASPTVATIIAASGPIVSMVDPVEATSLNAVGPSETNQGNATSAKVVHLDLSKLVIQDSSHRPNKSPLRKSPKKKTRVPSYTRHFQDAHAAARNYDSACLQVDNQQEHDIRWQGEVVHVDIDVPIDGDGACLDPLYVVGTQVRTAETAQQRHCMGQVYSFRELSRIRRHADGFRHVNEKCTFTELSSSSESSESEDEQIAVAPFLSSSDDDDREAVFNRGDKVLFFARHRWFKGTILRRIKKSWFYDIRASNGTTFEAVQAKRIRFFDGDDEPKYTFEVGDRVLWQPHDTTSGQERHQNYKARVLAIRRSSSASDHKRPVKKYELEVLTGRLVKRVPHDELRPLRRYR